MSGSLWQIVNGQAGSSALACVRCFCCCPDSAPRCSLASTPAAALAGDVRAVPSKRLPSSDSAAAAGSCSRSRRGCVGGHGPSSRGNVRLLARSAGARSAEFEAAARRLSPVRCPAAGCPGACACACAATAAASAWPLDPWTHGPSDIQQREPCGCHSRSRAPLRAPAAALASRWQRDLLCVTVSGDATLRVTRVFESRGRGPAGVTALLGALRALSLTHAPEALQ